MESQPPPINCALVKTEFGFSLSSITLLIFILFQNTCYSQGNKHSSDYYFQLASVKSQIPPGTYTDSLRKECILLYSKAIKLNPHFFQAYRNRGRLYSDLKLYKNAINDLTQAIRFNGKNEKWSLLAIRGQYYYLDGSYRKAIKDYNFAIPIAGNPSYFYLSRAKSYWKLGQKDKACADYSKALKLNQDIAKDKEFLNCN